LKSVSDAHAGAMKVAKVNVEEAPQVASKYQVMSIPTLLFIKNGQVMHQIVGLVPQKKIEKKLQELL
ncbi:MAG: thioredoxin family protein, partial [Candidatus Cloacimonetes bacterium]|nr:thioredoxin family protein [Candidatus Cloacimonadota bacterium]